MKLFVKLIHPSKFYICDTELLIKKNKKNISIEIINELSPTLYLIPIYTDIGIKLEKIVFPITGKIKNKKCIFYFNYIYKHSDIQKNLECFPDYFYSQIIQNLDINMDNNCNYYQQDLIDNLNILYNDEIIIEDFLIKILQLSLKIKNLILETDQIPKSLIELYQTKNTLMYNGQYFDNLEDLLKLKPNDSELNYSNGIKHKNGTNKFFIENTKERLTNYLFHLDFENLVKIYLNNWSKKELTKLNNIEIIYTNFFNCGLSNFQIILFIISNNLKISSNNIYFNNILDQSTNILNTKDFISITDINEFDLINLRVFLNKYPKFKRQFLIKSLDKIEYTMDFAKKNIDKNLLNLLLIFENDNFLNENKDFLNKFKPKLKQQLEILFLKKINLSSEKYYKDYTIRLFTKKYLLDSNLLLDEFNIYNFFRNYFYYTDWTNIINNFELINLMNKYSNILLFYGKINKVIFNENNFKDIVSIIKNKFKTINFLDSFIKIHDFIIFNQNDLSLILENYYSLSNYQIKNLAKIIYLSKFIDNNYNSKEYTNFINLCSKNNFILTNNNFNLKIKEYLNNEGLNYGKIVRDIKNYCNNKKEKLFPFEENIILKKLYLKYRNKYSKYKAKFLLEKSKNNPQYIKKIKIKN